MGQVEVTVIDTHSGSTKTLDKYKNLVKETLHFDFNSKEDFSPDNDSVKVATKFWNWILNPVGLKEFI
jgi:hypothetical protein